MGNKLTNLSSQYDLQQSPLSLTKLRICKWWWHGVKNIKWVRGSEIRERDDQFQLLSRKPRLMCEKPKEDPLSLFSFGFTRGANGKSRRATAAPLGRHLSNNVFITTRVRHSQPVCFDLSISTLSDTVVELLGCPLRQIVMQLQLTFDLSRSTSHLRKCYESSETTKKN